MKKLKAYISGKITGLNEDVARELFRVAEAELLKAGYEVVNPMTLPHNHDKRWESYMLENLAALSNCQCIYLLQNWRNSPGANIEKIWADRLNLIILTPNEVY